MAAFEAGRLHLAREAIREWRLPRHLPLYAAGLLAGVGIAIGAQVAIDQVNGGGATQPPAIQSPSLRSLPQHAVGQPALAAVTAPPVSGTLESEVLPDDAFAVPAPIVVDPAPAAPTVVDPAPAVPTSAPAASVPLSPAQPETAPALVVPAAPVAPPVPEGASPAPVEPSRPNFYVPAVAPGPMTNLEQRLFDGLNAERVAAGLAPYAYDPGLSTIARTRSQQMVDQGYFGHKDPFGYSMYVELLAHFGYTSYAWAGENLAVNNYAESESPERAVVSLMNSPTHRSNILQTLFTRVGIGEVTHADGRKFYSMIFLS